MTGAEAAQRILNTAGIYDVTIQHVSGNLTDHYNPSNKTLNLSDSVYGSTSVAAVGVAAHECGHAIQHQKNYVPLTLRATIVPVANLGSTLAWPLILIGLLFSRNTGALFIDLGIICFSFAVIFQLVTLPVEFNGIPPCVKNPWRTGNLKRERAALYEKSVTGGCSYLCGECSICYFTAAASDFTVWRKRP